MGNYRFRLSDMIPHAWFYKLKDMSKTRKHNTTSPKKKPPTSTFPPQRTHLSQTRYSYYITTEQQPNRDEKFYNSPTHPQASDVHFPEQPRRSSTKRSRRKAVYKPSPKKQVTSSSVSSGHCSCHASIPESPDYFGSSSSERNSPETHDFHELIPSEFESDQLCASEFGSYNCRVSSSTSDSIIDMKKEGSPKKVHDGFDMISELELPRILTKPMKFDDHDKASESTKLRKSTPSKLKETKGHRSLSVKIVKEERSSGRTQKDQKTTTPFVRNSSASPTGIRLRGNSPRLASKKLQQPCGARKSVSTNRGISDSFAVVKSSFDPQRDFKDSMREMIVENNLKESKDLEDLLACYLSLNSREYHDLIVKAFEQIWFDMAHIKISDS
ncbi:putative transcription factor OFP family [Rosa chinensis]|uniref:Transcription repressor n=1 Tax=Rosa chinensis TaxID=74649 RepID=A0A2P6QKP6_ROSCH|nr:transcription repressor OFP4 [Rosa chinensis]PRQ34760.1 putative transcription factor OFP family [Rosa chinensis]